MLDPLALAVLQGDFTEGDLVRIDAEGGELRFMRQRSRRGARSRASGRHDADSPDEFRVTNNTTPTPASKPGRRANGRPRGFCTALLAVLWWVLAAFVALLGLARSSC